MGLNSKKSKPNLLKVFSTSSLKTYWLSACQWLILLALGFSLSRTFGSYGWEFLLLVLIAMGLFLWTQTKNTSVSAFSHEVLLKFSVVFFLSRLWTSSSLYHALPERTLLLHFFISLALFSTLASLLLRRVEGYWIAFLSVGVLLLLIPYASPNPQIDVFTLGNKAIEHLLQGTNPYTVEYEDKLSTQFGYRPGYNYFPGALILTALASLISDYRWVYAVSLIVSALVLSRLTWKTQKNKEVAILFGLLWLSFPVTPLVVEQAWLDPLLVVTSALLALGLVNQNLWVISLSLGVHLSIKQYGAITLAVTALWLWKKISFKYSLKACLISLVVFLVITFPFFLPAPTAFLQMAIFDVFGQLPRPDSFTVYALLRHFFNIHLADFWTPIMVLLPIGTFWMRWNKEEPSLKSWSLCLFLATCLGFLFARRAFCNFFHYSSFYLVLYLACLTGDTHESNS